MGTRSQIEKLKSGVFQCPGCQTVQSYFELRRQKYYTVFFMRAFAVDFPEDTGQIECCGCGGQFDQAVLRGYSERLAAYEDLKPKKHDKHEDLQTTAPCPNCGRENSAHTRVCPRCETRLNT